MTATRARKAPGDDFNHVYPLPSGRTGYGSTTILGVMAKPALFNWAGKINRTAVFEAVETLYDAYAETMPTTTFMSTLIEQADKPHHTIFTKSAADIGTWAHKKCEMSVRAVLGMVADGDPFFDPRFLALTMEQQGKALQAFRAFEDWRVEHGVKFLGTEIRVGYESNGYRWGGTVDLLTERDGGHFVDDIKTSGAVYGSHGLQVISYADAANDSALLGFTDWQPGSIVRLPKSDKDAGVEIVSALDAVHREWPWLDLSGARDLFRALHDVCYATMGEPGQSRG